MSDSFLLFLILQADDGYVFIWSMSDGKEIQKLSPKQGPIVVVEWFNCAHLSQCYFLLSGGADGTVKMWRKTQEQVILVSSFPFGYLPTFWLFQGPLPFSRNASRCRECH